MEQKMKWLSRYSVNLEVRFEDKKQKFARPNVLLVDDWEKQVDPFIEAGGQAILFPQPWNRNHEFASDPLKYVLDSLTALEGTR